MKPHTSNIKVVPYLGENALKYVPDIAAMRIEVFAEYPFLYEGDMIYEEKYLSKYTKMKDSIVVVAFDGEEVIGVSTGYPLECELAVVQKCLEESGFNVHDFFCFGDSVLRKAYRGKGIGKQFMQEREAFVKELGRFKKICFFTADRPIDDPKKPEDYRPLDTFWKGRGFVKHPELTLTIDYTEIGDHKPSPKKMVFWIKDLR